MQKASFNFSGSRLAPIANYMSASVEQIERPLMTPDEVMRLRPPKKTGSGAAERITAPGDMLIFVSGHHPIYGTQILYYARQHLWDLARTLYPNDPVKQQVWMKVH